MRSLVVAVCQVGNYCARGREYVTKLFDGVARHMPADVRWRGVCFTDDPATVPVGIEARPTIDAPPSWWHKLNLFSPSAFEPGERVLFFDLDTIIVGDLRDFAAYDGDFAVMRDPFHPEHHGSATMAWKAGMFNHIWTRWDEAGRPSFDPQGDQRWIEAMQPEVDYWHDMFPGQIVSFKADCWLRNGIPPNARILGFHGRPRNHECRAPYIVDLWNQPPLSVAA